MNSALPKLVRQVAIELLASDGQTTPDAVAAEVRMRFPAEVAAEADRLIQDALTRQAHESLRDSQKRVESKQLSLKMPGYDLPRAIPVDIPDGTIWKNIRTVTLSEWAAWLAGREGQITADSAKVDADRSFGLFLKTYGFSDTVNVEMALQRAGIAL